MSTAVIVNESQKRHRVSRLECRRPVFAQPIDGSSANHSCKADWLSQRPHRASGMVFMTLILYDIFKPVTRASLYSRRGSISWDSALSSSLESCGCGHRPSICRIPLPSDRLPDFRSTFLPRILGALMAIAVWLVTYLSTPLATICLLTRGRRHPRGRIVMLWLLAMGVAVSTMEIRRALRGLAIACSRGHLIRSLAIQFSGGSMESLIALNCSTVECTSVSPTAPIWQDVLAQAMTAN